MTPDEMRIKSMQLSLTKEGALGSCWFGDELAIAIAQDDRTHVMVFTKEELLGWQRRAWTFAKMNPWLEWDECLAATLSDHSLNCCNLRPCDPISHQTPRAATDYRRPLQMRRLRTQ